MSADNRQVFINCPFSDDFKPLFNAIVFAVTDCGFRARCGLEFDDGGEVRVEKIVRMIKESRFGIHDLSLMGADQDTGLARLNMSFELGLFLGARRFGSPKVRDKVALILDVDRFRYQKALSDIAGQDIRAHSGEPRRAIVHVRDWLQANAEDDDIPGGDTIVARYETFAQNLPILCSELRLTESKLTFADLTKLMTRWLKQNA